MGQKINFLITLSGILLSFSTLINAQCASNVACFSPPIDVAKLPAHNLTVNSTCGSPPESFCVENSCSLICDSNNNQTHHPGNFLVDQFDLATYWKSKNFDEPVFILFDFGSKLILHQITITFQFELPNGLYLQRSQDFGNNFFTLAYYATRCKDTFGIPAATFYDKMNVLCFLISDTATKQISFAPRRDNYIATEVLKGGAVRDHYLATNIKIVLHEFFKPSDFDPTIADPRKFYFAIRDVDVQAACYCNGMSNQCSDVNYGTCICQKFTTGSNCEKCLDLYNNKPWRFGIACEVCSCYEHSTSCVYDSSKGYGVCQNCMHNTKGDKCDMCNTGFYADPLKEVVAVDYCKACNCFMDGVLFGSTVCHPTTGTCICKSNVEGGVCNSCKDGFYGLKATILNGCSVCACSTYGTVGASAVCNKQSGQCTCKTGFTGRTCSTCQAGYYGYPVGSVVECRLCNCHPSGSANSTCETSGQCHCRAHYYGVRCEQVDTGFFSASINQLWFSSSSATVSSPVSYNLRFTNMTDSRGNNFYVVGYEIGLGGSVVSNPTVVTFTVQTSAAAYYEFFMQYETSFSFSNINMKVNQISTFTPFSCDGGTTTVSINLERTLTGNIDPIKQSQTFGTLCLNKGTYTVTVTFPPNSAGGSSAAASLYLMSLLLIPQYQYSTLYQQSSVVVQTIIQQYYNYASSLSQWNIQAIQGAQYMSYLYGDLYNAAMACSCHVIGSYNPQVCNLYGGQCNCKENVYGRTCDQCVPNHYNFTSGLGCVACDCDPNGSLDTTCDSLTGQCRCKPNVVGRTCNQCAFKYYGLSTGNGCQPCNCHVLYSLSTSCADNGQCSCKPGVGSSDCSTCLAGYYDLSITGCKRCLCDPTGTSGNQCNDQTGSCTCKNLVIGARCNQCTRGYYGFHADFPETCLKCHCTGKTEECDAADEYYLTEVSTIFSTETNNNALSGWQSVDEAGQPAGTLSWDWAPLYSLKRGYARLVDTDSKTHLFYAAPDLFLGNKRSSYMYSLYFDLSQENDTAQSDMAIEGDVIIKGVGKSYSLVASLTEMTGRPSKFQTFRSYSVRFYETEWFYNDILTRQPTNAEMVETLSNLESLWIRGKWTVESGGFTGLSNVRMQYSTYDVANTQGLQIAKNVEYCTCPLEYSGQFCQNCNQGYTRQPVNGLPTDSCVECQCNSHSRNCNPQNGTCYNCLHNTQGSSCETCSPGYYGDATVGEITDCKECKCPGGLNVANQFAKTCILDTDDKPTCTNCATGYSGRQCEVCSDGYYGVPTDLLGTCKKCTCNNNIDPNAAGNCNTTSGECLRCLFNTFGDQCQFCRAGFYGDALSQSCQDCNCNLVGSINNDCQNLTGQCSCKPNVIGRICDRCMENTYNFISGRGCQLCECNAAGSASMQCNLVTGKCQCNPRVIGDKCDRCASGYYDLSKGCLPCNCSVDFTVRNTTCDANTGQCQCKESSLGGKYSGRTCHNCDVNGIGSPPNCELCHSPCYDNWQNYIDLEAADIAKLQTNVTDLLSRFGGLSYQTITSHLTWLNGNLTYVSEIFSGANYNITGKEKQFNLIEKHILDFEYVLDKTSSQLDASKIYFETTVANFDGCVSLSANVPMPEGIEQVHLRSKRQVIMVPSTCVDATMVQTMAEEFVTTSRQNNVSGRAIYSTIQEQFNQIIDANVSVATAAGHLAEAMSSLSQSAEERAKIGLYLDTQYKATYATNAYELKKIHDIVASILILQNRTVTIHESALAQLGEAQRVIAQAEQEARSRRTEAQTVSQTVSQMKVDAVSLNKSVAEQVKVSQTLKTKADEVLYDVNQENIKLAKNVIDIATARNKTEAALQTAYKISNTTLSVELTEIQSISNQIVNTVINEGLINATYADAQNGLVKAKEVETLSQQALVLSQQTLQDIRNLEEDIKQSQLLRQTALQIQNDNDAKIQLIQNISSQISSQYNSASGQGGQTLTLLKNAISQATSNTMCFVDAKATLDNATMMAEQAKAKSQDAGLLHVANAALLPTYSSQINNLYAQTSSTHQAAQTASSEAYALLQDVTEAERLLSEIMSQKKQLDTLQDETESLENELNDLLLKFENERVKFSGCARP